MLRIVIDQGEEKLEFRLGHGLNNELVIMAEEEEAATGACSFTRRKDLLLIFLRVEGSLDLGKVDFVQ